MYSPRRSHDTHGQSFGAADGASAMPRNWTRVLIVLLASQACASSETQDEFQAVLRAKVDASHGQVLFETCARCHGADGAGAADGSVPAIAGQHFRVLARQLVDYRHDLRWDVR